MYSTNLAVQEEPSIGRIDSDRAVRLRFWARDRDSGELLQYGDDLSYIHGGYGGVFPKVEKHLAGCLIGDRVEVNLDPAEGYGIRDPERVILQPKSQIPEEAWVPGTAIDGELPDGREMPFVVTEVGNTWVRLDANHPWAGKNLLFTFEVLAVREGNREELRMGFPLM